MSHGPIATPRDNDPDEEPDEDFDVEEEYRDVGGEG